MGDRRLVISDKQTPLAKVIKRQKFFSLNLLASKFY